MTFQELEHQLLELSASDKAELIQRLTKTISGGARGITKTPGVCGGEACIAGTSKSSLAISRSASAGH